MAQEIQLNFFDLDKRQLKITKHIRLIELFVGYGSQALALKYLGCDFTHYAISEWTIKAIQAYKDIHFTNDNTDYSSDLNFQDLVETLYDKGISSDSKMPLSKQQITRLGEKKLRIIYNNLIATNNLGSISKIKGKDLNIVDTDKYTYIMTYSFPCQDLSSAGNMKGMSRGGKRVVACYGK